MSQQSIAKAAQDLQRFTRNVVPFRNARSAFKAYLQAVSTQGDIRVLLPAFIGWSPREGSGVFDPVRDLQIPFEFYAIDERLRIDVNSVRSLLKANGRKLLVIIHYFGYVDPSYGMVAKLARQHGTLLLEDEAHAILSDLVGFRCGREGDAALYSFHKMFPVPDGGALVFNTTLDSELMNHSMPPTYLHDHLWQFDLAGIAAARRRNAEMIHGLIGPLQPHVESLWGTPEPGIVPQTYPILVNIGSRDSLYFALNDQGFGGTSLYHTIISEIDRERFPDSQKLASRIFNLPVHQDATPRSVTKMIDTLTNLVLEH